MKLLCAIQISYFLNPGGTGSMRPRLKGKNQMIKAMGKAAILIYCALVFGIMIGYAWRMYHGG